MTDRSVWGIVAVVLLAGIFACCCGAPLTWDGAYQFCYTLTYQRPYFYQMRFHSWLLWQPLVLLSSHTHNCIMLLLAFGMPFMLAPGVGLLASWWIVRRRAPHLFVWTAFGILAAPLPGQIFIINDSIFQQHLFWPVFLGTLVPLTRGQRIALAVLALFQLSHPIGVLLLLIAVAAAGLVAWRDRQRRRGAILTAAILLGLAAIGLAKILAFPDLQAADEFHLAVALNRWHKGVAGAPLAGLAWIWLAGLFIFIIQTFYHGEHGRHGEESQSRKVESIHAFTDSRAARASRQDLSGRERGRLERWARKGLTAAAIACIIIAGAIWVTWASDDHAWAFALDYRRWLVPLTVPFFVLCAIEGSRPKASEIALSPSLRTISVRPRLAFILAGMFAAVMGLQSVTWSMLGRRLVTEASAYPQSAVPRYALPWIEQTPLQHWGTVAYLSWLQGQTPRRILVLNAEGRAALEGQPPRVPLDPWAPIPPDPGPAGWFDFRQLIHAIRK